MIPLPLFGPPHTGPVVIIFETRGDSKLRHNSLKDILVYLEHRVKTKCQYKSYTYHILYYHLYHLFNKYNSPTHVGLLKR